MRKYYARLKGGKKNIMQLHKVYMCVETDIMWYKTRNRHLVSGKFSALQVKQLEQAFWLTHRNSDQISEFAIIIICEGNKSQHKNTNSLLDSGNYHDIFFIPFMKRSFELSNQKRL